MKKMIDLIAEQGTGKDEKLLNYIRKNYLKKNYITNLCFISGQEIDGKHKQLTAEELRNIVFNENKKDTIYFFRSFYFSLDRENYLKLIQDMCENNIQIFKTDQIVEHISSDNDWNNKYCKFLSLKDM